MTLHDVSKEGEFCWNELMTSDSAAAFEFYSGILGLSEVAKPANLARRGGVWFEGEGLRVHLGVEDDFRPAKKAHPAFLVHNLAALTHLIATGRNTGDWSGAGIVTSQSSAKNSTYPIGSEKRNV